jgi:DnaK suppressor protein
MSIFNRTQLADLAHTIDARDSQLRDEIRSALAQSGNEKYLDLAGQVHDRGDEAVANELIEFENMLSERHRRELREIESARGRLAAGNIGYCAECFGEIGLKRLMANPTAVRCVACQGQFEKNHLHEAASSL